MHKFATLFCLTALITSCEPETVNGSSSSVNNNSNQETDDSRDFNNSNSSLNVGGNSCLDATTSNITNPTLSMFKLNFFESDCIGEDTGVVNRSLLPISTVTELPEDITISSHAKLLSGSLNTISFDITNNSGSLFCGVNARNVQVLDSSNEILIEEETSYLEGEVIVYDGYSQGTCINHGQTLSLFRVLSFSELDLTSATEIIFEELDGSPSNSIPAGEFSVYEATYNENKEVVLDMYNHSSERIDLLSRYTVLYAFDSEGYMTGINYIDGAGIVLPSTAFDITFDADYQSPSFSYINVSFTWHYYSDNIIYKNQLNKSIDPELVKEKLARAELIENIKAYKESSK